MGNKCRTITFFGGFPLRSGAMAALTFNVLWGLGLVYWAAKFLGTSVYWEQIFKNNFFVAEISLFGGMYAVAATFAIISTVIFAVGISMNNPAVVLIWTIFDVIQIILASGTNIWILVGSHDQPTALFLGLAVIKIYFWFVSLSFYYELRILYPPGPAVRLRLT